MSDRYLWDKSGQPDPEIERLEEVLGALRSRPPMPPLAYAPPARRRWRRFALLAAAAVASFVLIWVAFPPAQQWTVSAISGAPQVGSRNVLRNARLRVGERVTTDERSSARLAVGHIASLEVDPNSSVQLVRSQSSEYRIALYRGKLHASISAPPRLFIVDTPSAVAVDLGCSYTLEVDGGGNSTVEVTGGLVSIESSGRESYIPAGAVCTARKGMPPGTPHYRDADPEFARALEEFDRQPEHAAITQMLARARIKDVLTLWHLVPRTAGADRAALVERAATIVPLPAGTDRNAVLEASSDALKKWWDAIRPELARIRRSEAR